MLICLLVSNKDQSIFEEEAIQPPSYLSAIPLQLPTLPGLRIPLLAVKITTSAHGQLL